MKVCGILAELGYCDYCVAFQSCLLERVCTNGTASAGTDICYKTNLYFLQKRKLWRAGKSIKFVWKQLISPCYRCVGHLKGLFFKNGHLRHLVRFRRFRFLLLFWPIPSQRWIEIWIEIWECYRFLKSLQMKLKPLLFLQLLRGAVFALEDISAQWKVAIETCLHS